MNAISGITIDMLAEISAKHSALQAQFGEPAFYAHFDAFLQSKGLNQHVYSDAHNAWRARFRADPTGQLEADFHMKMSRLVAQAHFGDVRDMSGDALEGVTLEGYVKISLEMGKPGADPNAIAHAHGLSDVAQWQKVNAAWIAAMAQDTSHKLSMQYGTLYQKYAGPQFEQAMREQVAAQSVASYQKRSSAPSAPPREQTVQELIALLNQPVLVDRYKVARELAHRWDIGHERDPSLSAALACIPVLIEMVERHEEDETSEAESAARKLIDLKQYNDDVRGSLQRCLNRAEEHLVTLQRAFAPIQNQAVPERIPMQMKIGGYQSLIGELRSILGDWKVAAAAPPPRQASFAPAPAFGPAGGGGPFSNAPMAAAKGGSKAAIVVPIVLVLALIGAGGTWFMRGRAARAAAASTSASSSASAASTADAPPATTVAAATPKAPPPVAAAAAPASTAAAKAPKKKR